MITFIMHCLATYAKKVKDEKDAVECVKVAKVFNNRYTYLYLYHGEYAWMCPECNHLHRRIPNTFQFLTGNHFPACCSFQEGHRLQCGIKTQP